jgi:hypothetical protein
LFAGGGARKLFKFCFHISSEPVTKLSSLRL